MKYTREAGMLREFGWISTGLNEVLPKLDEDERELLEMMYIVPKRGNLELLCEKLGVDKSSVYRRRNKALAKFTALWNVWEAGKWREDFAGRSW